MKKEDLVDKLNKCRALIEQTNLSYGQIRRLWMSINCLQQMINSYFEKDQKKGE